MKKIEFQYSTESKFNDIKDRYFGNVPLERTFDLFKEEHELNGIDLQKLVHRRTGDMIKDLDYDLEHLNEIGIFQMLIENVEENLNWIWNSFSRQDQIEFDKRFTKIIQLNSNPVLPRAAKLIKQLIKDGSLVIRKDLEDVVHKNGIFDLKFRHDEQWYSHHIIINATGSKTHLKDLDEDDQPILNLRNRQIIQAHPMGGIQIIPETNQVISLRYGTLNNMIAIGQITNGVSKLRNGVKIIVNQTVSAVDYLYETRKEFDHKA